MKQRLTKELINIYVLPMDTDNIVIKDWGGAVAGRRGATGQIGGHL